jgi:broad-specificity NMP kinase
VIYLVTGIPGAGKTTVSGLLGRDAARGYKHVGDRWAHLDAEQTVDAILAARPATA